MSTSYDSVRDALQSYAGAVGAAWRHPAFTPAYSNTSLHSVTPIKRLVTRANAEDPTRLPVTSRLVRGAEGVTVDNEEQVPLESRSPTVQSALSRAGSKWRTHPEMTDEEKAVVEEVQDAKSSVIDALADSPALLERTYDISGFKNDDLQGVRELISVESSSPDARDMYLTRRDMGLGWTLDWYLVEGLTAQGLDPASPASFDDWEPVIEYVISRFRELETRETWTYEVVALLNAPPIDHDGQLGLVATTVDGQPVTVTIEAATDKLLNDLEYRNYNFTGIGSGLATAPVNAALRYRVTVPVEAPMSEYVQVLASAVNLFTRIVDVLRLVRSDDLGIIGVESFSV